MEVNRYTNAMLLTPGKAAEINDEAWRIASKAIPILLEVERHPERASHPHPQTGGRWRGHYLSDAANTILEKYGVPSKRFQELPEVFPGVLGFMKRAEKYRMDGIKFGLSV